MERIDYNPRSRFGAISGCGITYNCTTNEYHLIGHGAVKTADQAQHWARELHLDADADLAIYMTMMLSSRTTEVRYEAPPEKLNRARMKRGNTPLPAHRIVTIVPGKYIDQGDAQGGTHRSPRLHWRRSHRRHYPNRVPSAVWLDSEQHKGVTGWWVGIIARQLVGLAKDGEVSHEYFVREGSQEKMAAPT